MEMRDYNITSFAQMTHPRKRRTVAFFGLDDYSASRAEHSCEVTMCKKEPGVQKTSANAGRA
jgi:hypothetical protein